MVLIDTYGMTSYWCTIVLRSGQKSTRLISQQGQQSVIVSKTKQNNNAAAKSDELCDDPLSLDATLLKQVCVQPSTAAVNVTLLAFAAERRASVCRAAGVHRCPSTAGRPAQSCPRVHFV